MERARYGVEDNEGGAHRCRRTRRARRLAAQPAGTRRHRRHGVRLPVRKRRQRGTTRSAPVRTPGRAQAVVRTLNQNMTGDVRVELADGTYPLAAPLALTSRDS